MRRAYVSELLRRGLEREANRVGTSPNGPQRGVGAQAVSEGNHGRGRDYRREPGPKKSYSTERLARKDGKNQRRQEPETPRLRERDWRPPRRSMATKTKRRKRERISSKKKRIPPNPNKNALERLYRDSRGDTKGDKNSSASEKFGKSRKLAMKSEKRNRGPRTTEQNALSREEH